MIRFKPLLLPTLIMLPSVALMLSLSLWQVERLHWKEGLIAEMETRLQSAPVSLHEALANGPANAEWRQVSVHGHFLHEKEAYLYAPTRKASGVHVLTPFAEDGGEIVLIDRGFVPDTAKDPASRTSGQVAGEVTLVGTIRATQRPGVFTPKPDLKSHLWFSRDVEAIAAAQGIQTQPFFIEAAPEQVPGGLPQGAVARPALANDHLGYALTWAGLALAMLSIYFIYHFRNGRLAFR